VATKFGARLLANSVEVPGAPAVTIAICGPEQSELNGTGGNALPRGDHNSRHGRGSRNEVDFDDPGLAMTGLSPETGQGIRTFNRMRLRIQLQYLYRMPIPFANWIISRIYLGLALPGVMLMDNRMLATPNMGGPGKLGAQTRAALMASQQRVYVLPINVSYAMRMQSNFFLQRYPMPTSNECIHYAP
jgi:hypothetical protein